LELDRLLPVTYKQPLPWAVTQLDQSWPAANNNIWVHCATKGIEAIMWKKDDVVGSQPTLTVSMYTEAMNKFTKSATAFMEQVHLLTEARDAYEEAMTASTALRNSLDAGDHTLRSLMTQLEQVVNTHFAEPLPDKKKPEAMKVEATG
jgi:hypothetical protein